MLSMNVMGIKIKSTDTFSNFFIQFEKLYDKIAKYEMALPEAANLYFLLNDR